MEEELGSSSHQLPEEEGDRKKRGRVELKRIEDRTSRQVRFSKRRSGLFKKAFELSVLCDAEVALVVFSPAGRLYEFVSSNSSIEEIFGRCRDLPNTIDDLNIEPRDSRVVDYKVQQLKNSRNEYLKLKARVDNLQRTQRNLLGEDLDSLGIKELESLEKQLDSSLKHIRTTRTQHMVDQLTELQRREQMFSEANKCLRIKLEESNQVHGQQLWEHNNNLIGYERQPEVQPPMHGGNGFFHPLDAAGEPTLHIGYPSHETLNNSSMTTLMPQWLP